LHPLARAEHCLRVPCVRIKNEPPMKMTMPKHQRMTPGFEKGTTWRVDPATSNSAPFCGGGPWYDRRADPLGYARPTCGASFHVVMSRMVRAGGANP